MAMSAPTSPIDDLDSPPVFAVNPAVQRIAGRARTWSTGSYSGAFGRSVLMAVDASDHAQFAFDWYLENIHRQDDLIYLIHCPEPPNLPTFSFKNPMAPPIEKWKAALDEMNTKTRKLEEDYEATCIQKKLKYKIRGETNKKPGEFILTLAEKENATMICMGTRGLSGLKRAVMGSVSDHVVKHSHIPVIVVPSKRELKKRGSSVSMK